MAKVKEKRKQHSMFDMREDNNRRDQAKKLYLFVTELYNSGFKPKTFGLSNTPVYANIFEEPADSPNNIVLEYVVDGEIEQIYVAISELGANHIETVQYTYEEEQVSVWRLLVNIKGINV